MSGCNCIDAANNALQHARVEIKTTERMFARWCEPVALVATEPAQRRGTHVAVAAQYCPFCGRKYGTERSETA